MAAPIDLLVIGSGIAGLRVALAVADQYKVLLITKKAASDSNTNYAQGGIASVLDAADSFESHVSDTCSTGAGLCHEAIVRSVVEAGPRLIEDLSSFGIEFSAVDGGSALELGREGGHTHRRIVHAGDFTGRELERGLSARLRAHPNIRLLEDHLAVDLIVDDARVVGALVLDREGAQLERIAARATLLATGGSGKVYRYTSNPDVATGDGLAMAYRAGATVANLEFFQFHPTCLFHPAAKNFLISEAVRGEGAILRNLEGEAFCQRYDSRADLAPRDIVARAIDSEMKRRGDRHVLLDTTVLESARAERRFPNIYARCRSHGLDPTRDALPVVPAAHYQCGGVVVDAEGGSDLAGLYVLGEAACTGLHGANRLASNSLLEALYFAHAVAGRVKRDFETLGPVRLKEMSFETKRELPLAMLRHDWEIARRIMWDYVGIVRDGARLAVAAERMGSMASAAEALYRRHVPTPELLELRNLTLVGSLVVESAGFRKESRGLHMRTDFPSRDDVNFAGDTHLRLGADAIIAALPPSARSGGVS